MNCQLFFNLYFIAGSSQECMVRFRIACGTSSIALYLSNRHFRGQVYIYIYNVLIFLPFRTNIFFFWFWLEDVYLRKDIWKLPLLKCACFFFRSVSMCRSPGKIISRLVTVRPHNPINHRYIHHIANRWPIFNIWWDRPRLGFGAPFILETHNFWATHMFHGQNH